jgi:hypothetical protein
VLQIYRSERLVLFISKFIVSNFEVPNLSKELPPPIEEWKRGAVLRAVTMQTLSIESILARLYHKKLWNI